MGDASGFHKLQAQNPKSQSWHCKLQATCIPESTTSHLLHTVMCWVYGLGLFSFSRVAFSPSSSWLLGVRTKRPNHLSGTTL